MRSDADKEAKKGRVQQCSDRRFVVYTISRINKGTEYTIDLF